MPVSPDPNAFYGFLTSLLTFATVVVGGALTWRKDRKVKADLLLDNAKIKTDLLKEQQKTKDALLSANAHIGRKIEENTELSVKAFTEANNFNAKIAAWERLIPTLPEMLNEMKRLRDQGAKIDTTTEDTNKVLHGAVDAPKT